DLNVFLGSLERDKRLVDLTAPELEARMADLPERALPFAAWDSFALGQSARPKALFEFALRRFAPASPALPTHEMPAVLRLLPLNRADDFNFENVLLPHAWNTRRFGVVSGAAV